jgi:hypothetical protein
VPLLKNYLVAVCCLPSQIVLITLNQIILPVGGNNVKKKKRRSIVASLMAHLKSPLAVAAASADEYYSAMISFLTSFSLLDHLSLLYGLSLVFSSSFSKINVAHELKSRYVYIF